MCPDVLLSARHMRGRVVVDKILNMIITDPALVKTFFVLMSMIEIYSVFDQLTRLLQYPAIVAHLSLC